MQFKMAAIQKYVFFQISYFWGNLNVPKNYSDYLNHGKSILDTYFVIRYVPYHDIQDGCRE